MQKCALLNKKKYCSILYVVDDCNRIKLREIPDVEGSDYINASYMDVSFFCYVFNFRQVHFML